MVKLQLQKVEEFKDYPDGYQPQHEVMAYNLALLLENKQVGVISLKLVSPDTALVSIYIKPEARGKIFSKEFWEQFYFYTFNGFGVKLVVANLEEPRLANILLRQGWQQEDNYFFITNKEFTDG